MLENDLVGVGAGPTNLSLAALIETPRVRGLIQFQSKFLEKNRAIQWHAEDRIFEFGSRTVILR